MPIYEFECNRCGKNVEIHCSYNDIKRLRCKCGGRLIKQFTTCNIIGANRFIRKPGGIDPAQDREDARKSLEKRKHMKLNKGGIL